LRSDLLALHGMAHTVIHGAPLTTPPGEETLTEMAASLSLVFSDAAEALSRACSTRSPIWRLTSSLSYSKRFRASSLDQI
jgi:hypothetical protein